MAAGWTPVLPHTGAMTAPRLGGTVATNLTVTGSVGGTTVGAMTTGRETTGIGAVTAVTITVMRAHGHAGHEAAHDMNGAAFDQAHAARGAVLDRLTQAS